MKTNKVTKLGISLLSVAALGVVAPALIDTPIFGVAVVKAEEQEPIKYRIRHLLEGSNKEIAPMETGVLNPGESINIRKNLEGYQAVSNYSWMPDYNLTYDIVSTYFYGAADGYREGYIEYRKLDADVKPSETPKPEVKPSEKPEAEEQQEPLKYRISYYDGETGEEITAKKTGVINPGETVNVYKDIDGYKVTSKDSWMPNYEATYDMVATYFHGDPDGYKGFYLDYKKLDADVKPSETPKPEVKPETKPSDTPKPEVKPETKPSETPKPEVKPETKPSDTPKPEVKPETKPSETPKPEVKPETKPSETPKPEVKPEPKPSETPKPEVKQETKPSETPKPEVKPETKPSDTPKPEVKPETKPSDTPKPGVKPETKPQTNSNTAPQAPVKPVGQDSNTKADKPVSKPETTALPNTGEQNSILGFAGFLLASLGLAGLTYKGRH